MHNGLGKWDTGRLYIHDSGLALCGGHMVVESTYQPQAWEAIGIGRGPFVYEGVTLECESCQSAARARR